MYSVGSEDDRRRSLRVTAATGLNGAHGPTPAYPETSKFLKEVVQRLSRSYADEESIESQRTESDAASGYEQPTENYESENVMPRRLTQHSCAHCDYRTPRKNTLYQHMQTHTKPFRCEECAYRAARHNTFTDHLCIHTGAKPYRCDHCDYRTAKKCNLVVHTRKHTGLKPYACAYGNCDYRATRLDVMRVHLRTHSGEKPYACPQCDYRTARNCGPQEAPADAHG